MITLKPPQDFTDFSLFERFVSSRISAIVKQWDFLASRKNILLRVFIICLIDGNCSGANEVLRKSNKSIKSDILVLEEINVV